MCLSELYFSRLQWFPNLPGNRPPPCSMVELLMWLSYGACLRLYLLLGVFSVRLLTRTTSLQRGPLEAPIAPVACS